MLIDSMKLAYGTFQGCRHLRPGVEATLDLLVVTLDEVQAQGTLTLDVPASNMKPLLSAVAQRVNCGPQHCELKRLDRLSESSRRLFYICCMAALELQRLSGTEARDALRYLGYALHIVPPLVISGKAIRPEEYQSFNFRVAACYWAVLSTGMQAALASMAGLELAQANKLACTDGFELDIFHSRSPKKN